MGHPFLLPNRSTPTGTGGVAIENLERSQVPKILSPDEREPYLEAAFLLKATGIPLDSWTREPVSHEVISVMAATLWGSLDTMIRTLGGAGPRSAMVEVDDRRILAMRVPSNLTLLLIAPRSIGQRELEQRAGRILERLPRFRRERLPHPLLVDANE